MGTLMAPLQTLERGKWTITNCQALTVARLPTPATSASELVTTGLADMKLQKPDGITSAGSATISMLASADLSPWTLTKHVNAPDAKHAGRRIEGEETDSAPQQEIEKDSKTAEGKEAQAE
jgi:hypothetical protein